MFTLYLKTHNVTGLKYLGYTRRDPLSYLGSGKYWKRHLSIHGTDVYTEILMQSVNKQDIVDEGKRLSALWNVVENDGFANLVIEQGDGGAIHSQKGRRWIVSASPKMGKHTNQWLNDDGTRRIAQSKRMKVKNPSKLQPKTIKQIAASSRSSRIATEASKKRVASLDTATGLLREFESKRALIRYYNITYDKLNYRLDKDRTFDTGREVLLFRSIQ